MSFSKDISGRISALNKIATERILILDGAMGAMIQKEPLTEDDFRGERFKDHHQPLKGCNDLLCLTKPHIISGIHDAYLKAGADIIETCSFNATSISLSDYGLADLSYEINAAAAQLARKAADAYSGPEKPRFVAGSMGPSSKSASIAPDLDDPSKRAVTWDALEAAYYDSARGLLDGGADIFLIETVFDTLNAKAAIFAVQRLAQERGCELPIIVSATVSDNGGRTLSGQSVEAFCVSVLHANPLALGLNCSFGAEKLKPHITALSAALPHLVIAYPNAGLPNSQGVYDETPESMANHLEEYMREGLVNIVGGCCGSTPAHIAAIAERAANYPARTLPERKSKVMLAGLDVLEISSEANFSKDGGTSKYAHRSEFYRLLSDGDYDGAVDLFRDAVDKGAAYLYIHIDDSVANGESAISNFLNLALQYRDIARLPIIMPDSTRWEVIEAALKCLQGRGMISSSNIWGDGDEAKRRIALAKAYGALVI